MGLFDKISDLAVGGITKAETLRIPYDELVKIIQQEFISGADDEFLNKIQKTAKGGFTATYKELQSINERYIFRVGSRPNGIVWLSSKPVWVFDNEANKFYQLDKNLKWKKFYKSIQTAIKMEKINRNR